MATIQRAITYRCSNDCQMSGCPKHHGELLYQSTSDAYIFCMNGREFSLERGELEAMLDLLKSLDRIDSAGKRIK